MTAANALLVVTNLRGRYRSSIPLVAELFALLFVAERAGLGLPVHAVAAAPIVAVDLAAIGFHMTLHRD